MGGRLEIFGGIWSPAFGALSRIFLGRYASDMPCNGGSG